MKSHIHTLVFLIISAVFFQPAHQYRLSKRELTEYDLTSFIVGTCSADKTDMLIQNLCDQTLQSALTGNFPYLNYYCQTVGVGMTYCNTINQYTATNQNGEVKRFVYRRSARSFSKNKESDQNEQEMTSETDIDQKLIMHMCIMKTKESSIHMNEFCDRKLQEVQQGRYPEIIRLCQSYPDVEYCQHVQSYLSPVKSIGLDMYPSQMSSATESIIEQEKTQ